MLGDAAGAAPVDAPAEREKPPVPAATTSETAVAEQEPEFDLLGWWHDPADRRMILLLLAIVVVSLALRALTWSAVADGAHGRYLKTTLFGGMAACLVWFLIRLQTTSLSRLPLVCAVLVLFSGDAIHYARLANPIARGAPVLQLTSSLATEAAARRDFDFETDGPGRVSFENGAVRLESPPNGTAYMIGRLASYPDVRANWWLPVGLAERGRAERIAFRATVNRTGGFYVVTEVRQLLVQVVSYGLHVTYPDENRQQKGTEIQHPVGTDGQPHDWLLTRDSQQISLSLDGKQVWSARSAEELNQVKLGETKKDPQHGGSMRVESVSYTATLDRQ